MLSIQTAALPAVIPDPDWRLRVVLGWGRAHKDSLSERGTRPARLHAAASYVSFPA